MNVAFLDDTSPDKMRPAFDFFEDFRQIFTDQANRKQIQRPEKKYGDQKRGCSFRCRLWKQQPRADLQENEQTSNCK